MKLKSQSYFRLKHYFISIDLDLDDDLYIYELAAEEQYYLYEVYKIHICGVPIVNQLGSWSKRMSGLNFVKDENKNIRRHDLRVSYQRQ